VDDHIYLIEGVVYIECVTIHSIYQVCLLFTIILGKIFKSNKLHKHLALITGFFELYLMTTVL